MAGLNKNSKLENTRKKLFQGMQPKDFSITKLQRDMLQTANSIPRPQVVSFNKSRQKNQDSGSASL
jgi:hypothetical protein